MCSWRCWTTNWVSGRASSERDLIMDSSPSPFDETPVKSTITPACGNDKFLPLDERQEYQERSNGSLGVEP
jgi:hypothetical protein